VEHRFSAAETLPRLPACHICSIEQPEVDQRRRSVASPQRHEGGPQVAQGLSGIALPLILADIDVLIGGFEMRVGPRWPHSSRVWVSRIMASLPGPGPRRRALDSWRGSAAGRETGNPTLRRNGGSRDMLASPGRPPVHARAPSERNLEGWVPCPRHTVLSTPGTCSNPSSSSTLDAQRRGNMSSIMSLALFLLPQPYCHAKQRLRAGVSPIEDETWSPE
jgi:hypothetical protein